MDWVNKNGRHSRGSYMKFLIVIQNEFHLHQKVWLIQFVHGMYFRLVLGIRCQLSGRATGQQRLVCECKMDSLHKLHTYSYFMRTTKYIKITQTSFIHFIQQSCEVSELCLKGMRNERCVKNLTTHRGTSFMFSSLCHFMP